MIQISGGKVICQKYVIKSVDSVMKYAEEKDTRIVITAHSVYEQMKNQLINMGWNADRIVIAKEELSFFKTFEYKCYLRNVNIYNPEPTVLNIELSGYCNCKCIYCPFHGEVNLKQNHKGLMDELTMNALIQQIKNISSIKTVDTTAPGEIFINPQWFQLLQKLLVETSIDEVCMYTNGMLLTEDNIRKITQLNASKISLEISIDGESPEENDEYRIGAKYEKIRSNIYRAKEILSEVNKDIRIIITNCYPANVEDIEKEGYLVNSKEKKVPSYLEKDFPDLEITSKTTFFYGSDVELSKFKKIEVGWKNKESRCMNLFYRMAVNYAGELLRCSCGHAGILGIGSVFENDLLELWKKDKEVDMARKNIIAGVDNFDFCTGCPGKGMGKYHILVRK